MSRILDCAGHWPHAILWIGNGYNSISGYKCNCGLDTNNVTFLGWIDNASIRLHGRLVRRKACRKSFIPLFLQKQRRVPNTMPLQNHYCCLLHPYRDSTRQYTARLEDSIRLATPYTSNLPTRTCWFYPGVLHLPYVVWWLQLLHGARGRRGAPWTLRRPSLRRGCRSCL